MSALITDSAALARVRRATSYIPMGLTSEFLSRVMSMQVRRGWMKAGSIGEEQRLRATRAREWQRSSEADSAKSLPRVGINT